MKQEIDISIVCTILILVAVSILACLLVLFTPFVVSYIAHWLHGLVLTLL